MRLIDADALKEELNSWAVDLTKSKFPHYVKDDADCIIDTAPTIDAVPVVRCKDCKFHGVEESMGEQKPKLYLHYCEDTNRIVEPTCFCSFGERKDDEID